MSSLFGVNNDNIIVDIVIMAAVMISIIPFTVSCHCHCCRRCADHYFSFLLLTTFHSQCFVVLTPITINSFVYAIYVVGLAVNRLTC